MPKKSLNSLMRDCLMKSGEGSILVLITVPVKHALPGVWNRTQRHAF